MRFPIFEYTFFFNFFFLIFFSFQNPMAQIEEEKKEHQHKMLKMEKEMEDVFERKVREKQQKLKDSETDLERRHKESKEKLDQQKRELEARLAAFEQVCNVYSTIILYFDGKY